MIWRVLKVETQWQLPAYCAAAAAAGPWLGSPQSAKVIALTVLMMTVLQAEPHRRGSLFLAALPVPGRTLFAARVCWVLAHAWLPAASAAATILIFRHDVDAAAGLAEVALAITPFTLLIMSLRPEELGSVAVSRLLWIPGYVASFAIAMAAPAGLAAAVCAALSIGLFWWTWRRIPPGPQLAPVEAARSRAASGGGMAPAFAWWPILREMFPLQVLIWLPLLVFQAISSRWVFSPLMAFFPIIACLMRANWVLTLPVRRAVLLAVVLTVFALPALGGSWTVQGFATAVAVTALLLAAVDGWLAARHHRFLQLSRQVRGAWYTLAAAPFVWLMADALAHRGARTEYFLGLAVSRLGALPIGLCGLGLLWSAFRLFDGLEYLGPPPPTMWDRMSRA